MSPAALAHNNSANLSNAYACVSALGKLARCVGTWSTRLTRWTCQPHEAPPFPHLQAVCWDQAGVSSTVSTRQLNELLVRWPARCGFGSASDHSKAQACGAERNSIYSSILSVCSALQAGLSVLVMFTPSLCVLGRNMVTGMQPDCFVTLGTSHLAFPRQRPR